MSLPLIVRPMALAERNMVLSNWKEELREERLERRWGRGLTDRDYWCLINHVLDKITLPSCEVFVGVHVDTPETPVCWVSVRGIAGLSTYEVVYLYGRLQLRDDLELAASVERTLLYEVQRTHVLVNERRPFNPFLELRR